MATMKMNVVLSILIATGAIKPTTALLLLSDLPTPSFIVDLQALRRVAPPIYEKYEKLDASILFVPHVRCPQNGMLLHPSIIENAEAQESNEDSPIIVDCEFPLVEGQPAIGYLHSSVVRAREDAIPGEDDPTSSFLAEIDLDPALCSEDARLVLGLNNHHVGGYYWARAAGAGSSMEAPGVEFDSSTIGKNSHTHTRGILRWLDEEGPTACNSNDGKRSEWVNFLRKDDTVQLVPADGQDSLLQFSRKYGEQVVDAGLDADEKNGDHDDGEDNNSIRVFGISSQGRPMGSEPEVVCEWRLS